MDFMPSGMASDSLATVLIKLLIQNSKSRTARQLYIGFPFGRRTLFLNRRSRQFFILHSSFFIHLPPRFVSILSNIYYKMAKNVAINEKELYFCNRTNILIDTAI